MTEIEISNICYESNKQVCFNGWTGMSPKDIFRKHVNETLSNEASITIFKAQAYRESNISSMDLFLYADLIVTRHSTKMIVNRKEIEILDVDSYSNPRDQYTRPVYKIMEKPNVTSYNFIGISIVQSTKIPIIMKQIFFIADKDLAAFQVTETVRKIRSSFASRCIDYAKLSNGKYSSQNECKQHCYANYYYARTGNITFMYFYSDDETRLLQYEPVKSIEVLKQCRHECLRLDCTNQVFDSMQLYSTAISSTPGYHILPKMKVISNVFYDKFTFIEYLVVSGGIINLWLGISLLNVMNVLKIPYKVKCTKANEYGIYAVNPLGMSVLPSQFSTVSIELNHPV